MQKPNDQLFLDCDLSYSLFLDSIFALFSSSVQSFSLIGQNFFPSEFRNLKKDPSVTGSRGWQNIDF